MERLTRLILFTLLHQSLHSWFGIHWIFSVTINDCRLSPHTTMFHCFNGFDLCITEIAATDRNHLTWHCCSRLPSGSYHNTLRHKTRTRQSELFNHQKRNLWHMSVSRVDSRAFCVIRTSDPLEIAIRYI